MDVVRIMGIELIEWKDKTTGETKGFDKLHVIFDETDNPVTTGKRCDVIPCPKNYDSSNLQLGGLYELQYSHFRGSHGLAAKVSGLVPVQE